MPDKTDAKKILTAFHLENWRRLLGHPILHVKPQLTDWHNLERQCCACTNFSCWDCNSSECDDCCEHQTVQVLLCWETRLLYCAV